MKFYHYSKEPFEFDPSFTYRSQIINDDIHGILKSRFKKPTGLWLSYEENNNGFKNWCEEEEYAEEGEDGYFSTKYKTEFNLKKETCIVLETIKDVKLFTEKYLNHHYNLINWEHVKKDYGGIIIIPFIKNVDLEIINSDPNITVNQASDEMDKYQWYVSLDYESACVWDLTILEIKEK